MKNKKIMSVRLIKISKDLNVGLNTAVEFLQKKGVKVESNPNAKVDATAQELLIKEFGTPAYLESFKRRQASKKSAGSATGSTLENKGLASKTNDTDSSTKEAQDKGNAPAFNVVDKIELDEKNRPVKQHTSKTNKQEKETNIKSSTVADIQKGTDEIQKHEPEQSKSNPANTSVKSTEDNSAKEKLEKTESKKEKHNVSSKEEKHEDNTAFEEDKKTVDKNSKDSKSVIVEKPKAENKSKNISGSENSKSDVATATDSKEKMKENQEEELFRFREHHVESNIVIKGTIDLTTINDKTRPPKKSKAEKKNERTNKQLEEQKKHKEKQSAMPTGPKKELVKKSADDAETADTKKKKRNRIQKGRVDIQKTSATSPQPREAKAKPIVASKKSFTKAEVSDEAVQKQIKETLARLTDNKRSKNKGARYRKEKRDAQSQRLLEEKENQEKENLVLKITEFVTANDLANMMNIPVVQVIQTCIHIGMMVSINQRLDAETINIVAEEFGYKTEYVSAEVVEAITVDEDKEEDLLPRAPIVTVMGHVDHGKTSLLDCIRQTNVIAGEAGGITQHIGAYNVQLKSGKHITFLDTPGHEAFTAMRARGAQITDVAIIIVAADDSVMPQTIEAINHASAAGVPMVFAINKIDKPGANPEKIKEALAGMNYLVEDWGGKYQSQEISAKKGLGIDDLLEKVLLEAEILDLKANPNRRAIGSVIESSLDKGRGYTSTILVQNGTLKVGDIVVAGTSFGRIRAMFNERNQRITEAKPAQAAQILGLNGAPQAGDSLHVLETEQEAREITNKREQLQREQGLRTQKILTLEDIGRRIAIGNFQQLNLIVKGDMDGSVEALSDSLLKLSSPEIQLNVIHKGVGQISESDVSLAAASDAIIVGFQVRPSQQARRLAESEGVDIRLYSIIYDAIEEIKDAMEGMLSPEIKEVITGYVEVREIFKITKVGTVAGCFVKEGKLKKANKIRLVRDGIVIYSGLLGSLKRYKDEVKEVVAGLECGLNITNYNDIKVGDIIEPFEEIEIKKTL